MKISLSPLSFNLNNQVRNNKIQNQPRLKPMASDSISFNAKIPTNLQAELKYQKLLQEDERGKLTYLAESTDPEVLKLLKQMIKRDSQFVTVIYGQDVTDEQAQTIEAAIQEKYGQKTEITVINGGQPIYYYIISVE